MGRVLLAIMMLAMLAAICWALLVSARYMLKRHRQRHMARHAPELLRYEDLDPRVAELLVQQKRALEAGINTVSQMLNDPVMLIPSMYADPLQEWVNSNRKELGR